MKAFIRVLATSAIFATALGLATTHAHAVSADSGTGRKAVAVQNFTEYTGIGQYVADKASNQIYSLLRQRQDLAVFVEAFPFESDSHRYCVAHSGLTYAAPKSGLHPRVPQTLHFGAASERRTNTDDGDRVCARAVTRALDILLAKPTDALLTNLDQTLHVAGPRTPKQADVDMVITWYSGMLQLGVKYIRSQLEDWFPHAFDYRRVQLRAIHHAGLMADNEQRVCFGYLGLTMRAPEGRTPRVPQAYSTRAKLLEPTDSSNDKTCFDPVFDALTAELTPSSRIVANFIDGANFVAEADLAPIRRADVDAGLAKWNRQQALAKAAKPSTAVPVATAQRVSQTNSCQVRCVNGDCVRTWPGGRSERFQAPRKFNPFSGQFEWDTSGC